ncbi:DNA sulfur modification protein DndB [Actinosynnema pretiosum subsp. pretiosum]|uniref:DGQHR domain protein n=2 Tax=Actinosynnema TaxID=40566 RepID=C6WD27_ACTMD|nr:DNA sulfur modification protein DndB [Actinosynnema mirum]ACU37646.1 DGQHR domain protein [Actinosynnema mirum DSM 43827]AXX31078.1 DNA sulfur modification protein DndB [Actinosynnema pretiosum subsp. pretiosum]QUF04840.1 DNA sulfur modification protein DndB [Actinosynnema pretiosum subsp. pretiosum]
MSISKFNLIRHKSLTEAQQAAYEAAASSDGRVLTCAVFQQGGRIMLSTAFTYSFLVNNVKADSAVKGGSPRLATNRPVDTSHVRSIVKYLGENLGNYIMPPLTLNVKNIPILHVPEGSFGKTVGFAVIGDDTKFSVTDGQHRLAAIKKYGESIDDPESAFMSDGISVVIVIEPDTARIHQDFADAAQTKQIPASLLAVYNTREPLNRVLTKVVEEATLFCGRIDETSKSLPKNSPSIFLLNQVRGMVKELLFHDYALSESSIPARSNQVIGSTQAQDLYIARIKTMLEILTKYMTPWNAIAELPTSGGPANQVVDYRKQYINMTATGLVIIGHVAYEIEKNPDPAWREQRYVELAQKIDWRRDAEIWQNNIISGDKITTVRGPGRVAAGKVMEQLGLRAPEAPEAPVLG